MKASLYSARLVRALFLVSFAGLLAACLSFPEPQFPPAAAFVATEVASVAASGSFDYEIVDFTDVTESARGIETGDVVFTSLTRNIGFELGKRITGAESPPNGQFLGSPPHLRIRGAGTIRLATQGTVLGMHVVLPSRSAQDHLWIHRGTDARLTVTGINRGAETGTVKSVIAASDGETTLVTDQWTWVDLTPLGLVTELEVTFESPLEELPTLLIDNVTVSTDFRPDTNYFTIALLPTISEYIGGDAAILRSQLDYLSGAGPRREPIVFVSQLGGITTDPESDEEWELAADLLLPFMRRVPSGLAIGAGDIPTEADPSEGSERYLDAFGVPDELRSSGVEYSEDGFSSYRTFETPVGEVLDIHIAIDAPGDTVDWAQSVLDSHRGLPTMISTPRYLDVVGGQPRRLESPALTGDEETWSPESPQDLWENLIWRNSQVFLVASGDGPKEAVRRSRNRGEQPVVEMLVSYEHRPNGGEGYLRLLRFYPRRNEMRALTYSPYLDMYEQDADSAFVLPVDISGRLGID